MKNLLILITLVFSSVLTGCSKQGRSPILRPKELQSSNQSLSNSDRGSHFPWEAWTPRRDLKGSPLSHRTLLEADEYLSSGDRNKALDLYKSIKAEQLGPAEKAVLSLRLSSMYLSFNQANEALNILSKYFTSLKKREEDVDARFSLVFGYAYGGKGDIDQSLAWFSRTHRLSSSGLSEGSAMGVKALLKALPASEFQRLGNTWTTDNFVSRLIGEERRRRSSQSYNAPQTFTRNFWEVSHDQGFLTKEHARAASVGKEGVSRVVALLPLTGQYASLGTSIKNGIDLALRTENNSSPEHPHSELHIDVSYHDDGGDTIQASVLAQDLIGSTSTSLVLGPLLSDAALRVSEILLPSGIPMLTFSKSPNFQTGNGVYRFGPTIDTQIESLLETCERELGLSRYAMLFPNDISGIEYARVFKEKLQNKGLQLVFEKSYSKGDYTSFASLVEELSSSGTEAVFLPDNALAAIRLLSALPPSGPKIKVLGTASLDNPLEIRQSRAALEGIIFVSPFFKESSREEVSQFVKAYHEQYGNDPDFLAAQGFDAATLTFEALKRSAEKEISFAEALQHIGQYDGLTGLATVEPNGEITRKFGVLTLEEGKLVEINSLRWHTSTREKAEG